MDTLKELVLQNCEGISLFCTISSAYLNQRLVVELIVYQWLCLQSSIHCQSICPPFVNIFSHVPIDQLKASCMWMLHGLEE